MSLGPPFDDSGERTRILIGAAAGIVLIFVTTFALLAAERTLGDSVLVHVMVARPGALHTGAPLRVAGEPIGEVVAIRGQRPRDGEQPQPAAASPGPGPDAPVDIEVRILSRYRQRVFRNSTFVTVNPTLLTEAVLELGPPEGGAAPGEPVQDGDRLRGVDPADIDQFMLKVYTSVESVLKEAHDLGPDFKEFEQATSQLSTDLQGTLPSELLLRLGLHAAAARVAAGSVVDKLRLAGVENAPADLRALASTSEPLLHELVRFAAELDLLQGRTSDVAAALGPRERQLTAALASFRSVVTLGERAQGDVRDLVSGFEAGRGTLGGFNRDIQIFDELKELHRILKRRSWRVIIKRPDPGQRQVR